MLRELIAMPPRMNKTKNPISQLRNGVSEIPPYSCLPLGLSGGAGRWVKLLIWPLNKMDYTRFYE
jgi:hypothetical protein